MKIPKILIIVGAIILVFLIILTFILTRRAQEKNKQPEQTSSEIFRSPELKALYASYKTIAPKFTVQELDLIDRAKRNLPYSSEDFDVAYSNDVSQFIVTKKTDKADEEFNKWLAENGLSQLYSDRRSMFLETDIPLNDYLYLINKFAKEPESLPPGARFLRSGAQDLDSESDSGLSSLVDLFKTLVSFEAVKDLAVDEQGELETPPGEKEKVVEPTDRPGEEEEPADEEKAEEEAKKTGDLYGACRGLAKDKCNTKKYCNWFLCGTGKEDDRCARQKAGREQVCATKPPKLEDEGVIASEGLASRLLPNPLPAISSKAFGYTREWILENCPKNKSVYLQAQQQTGVPWEVLAGIHYREGTCNPNLSLISGRPIGNPEPDNAGKTYNSLLATAIAAATELKAKIGGHSPKNFNELISAAQRFHGTGGKNCGQTSLYKGPCPPPDGIDDPYPMNFFDEDHSLMYKIYCADHVKCNPPQIDKRHGVATVVRMLLSNE